MTRLSLHDLSPAHQAEAMACLRGGKLAGGEISRDLYQVTGDPYSVPQKRKDGAGKRIRQTRGDGMNNTERRYYLRLVTEWDYVYREPALPLANGVKYKLDFLVVGQGGKIEGHEVKGRAFATGIVKVKMAARLFPWISFRLVTEKKGGGWDVEEVLK
jgi:hypothetical protein